MPFYKGRELLKMHLTWNKCETKEIIKLGVKFGKTIPSQKKRPILNEVDLPPKRVANVIVIFTFPKHSISIGCIHLLILFVVLWNATSCILLMIWLIFFHLLVVVQDVIDYGFAWFPKIHQSNENVFPSWHDLLGLLVSTMNNNILSLEKNRISSTRLPIEQFLTYIMLKILNCWKTCGAMTHCFLTNTNSLTRWPQPTRFYLSSSYSYKVLVVIFMHYC
jgi:hypothetical protein